MSQNMDVNQILPAPQSFVTSQAMPDQPAMLVQPAMPVQHSPSASFSAFQSQIYPQQGYFHQYPPQYPTYYHPYPYLNYGQAHGQNAGLPQSPLAMQPQVQVSVSNLGNSLNDKQKCSECGGHGHDSSNCANNRNRRNSGTGYGGFDSERFSPYRGKNTPFFGRGNRRGNLHSTRRSFCNAQEGNRQNTGTKSKTVILPSVIKPDIPISGNSVESFGCLQHGFGCNCNGFSLDSSVQIKSNCGTIGGGNSLTNPDSRNEQEIRKEPIMIEKNDLEFASSSSTLGVISKVTTTVEAKSCNGLDCSFDCCSKTNANKTPVYNPTGPLYEEANSSANRSISTFDNLAVSPEVTDPVEKVPSFQENVVAAMLMDGQKAVLTTFSTGKDELSNHSTVSLHTVVEVQSSENISTDSTKTGDSQSDVNMHENVIDDAVKNSFVDNSQDDEKLRKMENPPSRSSRFNNLNPRIDGLFSKASAKAESRFLKDENKDLQKEVDYYRQRVEQLETERDLALANYSNSLKAKEELEKRIERLEEERELALASAATALQKKDDMASEKEAAEHRIEQLEKEKDLALASVTSALQDKEKEMKAKEAAEEKADQYENERDLALEREATALLDKENAVTAKETALQEKEAAEREKERFEGYLNYWDKLQREFAEYMQKSNLRSQQYLDKSNPSYQA